MILKFTKTFPPVWVVAENQRRFSRICRRGGWDESTLKWLRPEDDQSGLYFEDILGTRYTNLYRLPSYKAGFVDGMTSASRMLRSAYPLKDFVLDRGAEPKLTLIFDDRTVDVELFFKTPVLDMRAMTVLEDWIVLEGEDVHIKYHKVGDAWLEYPTHSSQGDYRTKHMQEIDYILKHRELMP